MFKFSNVKHTKSKTKKNSKSEIKEKLSEQMTDYEKYQRNEKRKAAKEAEKQAEKQAEMQKKIEYPQKQGFEDKKVGILGGPQTGIVPLQGSTPPPTTQFQEPDPIKTKCEAIGQDEAVCNANKPDCFFSRNALRCFKSKPNPNPNYKYPGAGFGNPGAGFGNPPPTLGTTPQQNPFTIPQQQPQALM